MIDLNQYRTKLVGTLAQPSKVLGKKCPSDHIRLVFHDGPNTVGSMTVKTQYAINADGTVPQNILDVLTLMEEKVDRFNYTIMALENENLMVYKGTSQVMLIFGKACGCHRQDDDITVNLTVLERAGSFPMCTDCFTRYHLSSVVSLLPQKNTMDSTKSLDKTAG